MRGSTTNRRALVRVLLLCLATSFGVASAATVSPDHHEFDATLYAPYLGTAGEARQFELNFGFPDAIDPSTVAWRVELISPEGRVLRAWRGEERLFTKEVVVSVPWDGRGESKALLPAGHYGVRMLASAGDPIAYRSLNGTLAQRVDRALAAAAVVDVIEQRFDIQIGNPPKPAMPHFDALPVNGDVVAKSAAATAGLPYTVYYGDLHSQTNHSDGGGAIGSCTSSQAAQTGAFGPNDAFVYGQGRGLDVLVTSEHNHYFDGSSNTNTSANPTTAKNLYQSGLTAASSYNAAHPGFLAVYGMEWGVINNGGHLNIFNSTELLSWEYNSSNQLLGDTFSAKSDYAALYALMKNRGWIGQFNHPASSGQFIIGSTALAYSADGDQVMVLAELQNTSAFSANTTESETSKSSYATAYNTLLERGYHVAPASNQDNHCANWGASYTNRTAVLLPTGSALNTANYLDALRARRVFATEDKQSQLILTANSHVMGERFNNSGSLTLTANFANSAGRTVSQAQIYEGVPGRNGTVSLLSSTAVTTITPNTGAHFYYAKLTQSDGKVLWSAPVWVTQGSGGDTTAPTVSASESGSSGTITLSASASDNVGVTKVEFLVDGALKATDTSSPYSSTLDSATLSNGTHSLTAKAYDAANNIGTSSAVSFSVNNSTATERVVNGGFESGSGSWTATAGVITNDSGYGAHAGTWKGWMLGYGSAHTDTLYQSIAIPAAATSASLSFWLSVSTDETGTTAYDTMKVEIRNTSNTVLGTLATYSNLNAGGYVKKTFDVSAYKGQTIRVYFNATEGSLYATSFVVDDVSLVTQ